MTPREAADRITVMMKMGCVKEVVQLIFENSDSEELIAELRKDDEARHWAFLACKWNSKMHGAFLVERLVPLGGTLDKRIEEARRDLEDDSCVEELAPLIFRHSNDRELIGRMIGADEKVRSWLYWGAAWGSEMQVEFVTSKYAGLPDEMIGRIQGARRAAFWRRDVPRSH